MRFRNSASHLAMMEVLRAIREELGIKQVALSKRLKRPPNWVNQVETGTRMLNVSEFIHWCRKLGRDPSEVLKEIDTHKRVRAGSQPKIK